MDVSEEQQKTEELSFDIEKIAKTSWLWIQKNYVLFLLLIPILLSIYIRVQTVYLPVIDSSAENNIRSYIQASIEQSIAAQYPNLPDANKQTLAQEQLEAIYGQGTINFQGQEVAIDALVEENAQQIKANFQDDSGLTYLGEIDPWYFYRLTENYLDHGYEGDIELNGRYYDDHQMAGTPREYLGGETSRLPHFHVMVEVYLYKIVHLFAPNIRLMTVVYFLPVLLATLSVIPAFFLVKRVGGALGGLAAATLVAVHPAFIGRTIAGFSDTDGYNILFPLVIMWVFVEAIEAERWKKALSLAAVAGLLMGVFSWTWGGWWYIYDFLLGVCLVSLWYLFVKEYTEGKDQKTKFFWIAGAAVLAPVFVLGALVQTLWKGFRDKAYQEKTQEQRLTLYTLLGFLVACGIFVSLFSGTKAFFGAVQEPLSFSTIKEVGLVKIWPNVLTTVAEFNPAGLSDIIGTISFGMGILLLLAFYGIGYILFEKETLEKEQLFVLSLSFVWILLLIFLSGKITSLFLFSVLLLVPLGYCFYKKLSFETLYFVGTGVWYALLLKAIPIFASHLFLFFFLLAIPVFVGIGFALFAEKKIDLKYGVLLLIWFIGTIYASTKGVRFIMILVPAFSVAAGLGIAFLYHVFRETAQEYLKLRKIYIQGILFLAVGFLFILPVSIGVSMGKQQLPLINDQWYDALKKIDNEAAPDAIVNSWWDFGHWFKAIADRPVTFDGGSQDTPQAHWIGKVLLTDNEQEAVAILRMLDCGGNSAYDFIYNATNDSYASIKLTKQIIMETEEEAAATLQEEGFSEELTEKILNFTHCDPPEDYFITSQDMVGKAPVWAHFGAWDFDKAHVVNLVNAYDEETAVGLIQADLGVAEETAQQLYTEATTQDSNNWISPWPSYVSMPTSCWQESTVLLCEAGLLINLTTGDPFMQTNDGLKRPLHFLSVAPSGEYILNDYGNYSDALLGTDGRSYSAALVPSGAGFGGFLMDTDLLESMFTKLFFFKGHGLECFDLFDYKTTVTGEEIYVWKVDWNCSSANAVFENPETNETSEENKTEAENSSA